MVYNKLKCDICGRSEETLAEDTVGATRGLKQDADGLWFCETCWKKMADTPVSAAPLDDLPAGVQALIGKSAGTISHVLSLPSGYPYQTILEAAYQIAYEEDRYMSTWLLVTQWEDGTTVWEDEAGLQRAYVSPGGVVRIHPDKKTP